MPLPATDFHNFPGLGMEASLNGTKILMGSRRLLLDRGISLPAIESGSEAEVWIANRGALGVIYLQDEVRPAAKGVIDFLKRNGFAVAPSYRRPAPDDPVNRGASWN